MAEKDLTPDRAIAALLEGKSRREMMVILAANVSTLFRDAPFLKRHGSVSARPRLNSTMSPASLHGP